MSKVRVDIIEDSSGNAIRFPDAKLADGYLEVSSNGTLSSRASLPQKTEFIKIYDCDVDGVLQSVNVEHTLTDSQIEKIIGGARCIVYFAGLLHLSNGWRFQSENGSNVLGGQKYMLHQYSAQQGQSQTYSNSYSWIPNGHSAWTSTLCTNMVSGIGICEFQITDIAGYPSITWRVFDTVQYGAQRRDNYLKSYRYEGHGPFNHQTNPLKKLFFNGMSLNYGGGVTLMILGDDD